jgi:hypothetical protein
MQNRNLLILAGTAALMLVAGLMLTRQQAPQSDARAADQPLLPALSTKLGSLDAVTITEGGGKVAIELKREGERWVLANKDGYPADVAQLRSYLGKLADAKLREQKTSNPERHAALGVEAVDQTDARGLMVTLGGIDPPVKLITGSLSTAGAAGTFVRFAEDPQSWLASGTLRPETALANWIPAEIVNLPANRLQSATITAPDGAVLTVAKNDPADANWTIQDVPRGKEPNSEFAGNVLTSTPDNLRLDDVLKAEGVEPEGEVWRARYVSFDGVAVTLELWQREGKDHARVGAEVDEARFNAWLEAEVAKQQASQAMAKQIAEQSNAAAAGEATAPGGEGATEGAAEAAAADEGKTRLTLEPPPFDEAKFREEKAAGVRGEVEGIRTRTADWVYVIPSWKAENVRKRMADLLKS